MKWHFCTLKQEWYIVYNHSNCMQSGFYILDFRLDTIEHFVYDNSPSLPRWQDKWQDRCQDTNFFHHLIWLVTYNNVDRIQCKRLHNQAQSVCKDAKYNLDTMTTQYFTFLEAHIAVLRWIFLSIYIVAPWREKSLRSQFWGLQGYICKAKRHENGCFLVFFH